MKINFKANETVVKAQDTLFTSAEGEFKGKLIITNQRIYFKSYASSGEEFDFELLPGEIIEVIYYNKLRFIPIGQELKTKKGELLKFTLRDRDSWCRLITAMN